MSEGVLPDDWRVMRPSGGGFWNGAPQRNWCAILAARVPPSHNGDMVIPRREQRVASVSTGLVAVGSVVAFAALVVALWWREHHERAEPLERPLIVYAAPASRLPLEEIRIAYEHETGRFVDIRYEPSEVLLEKVRLSHPTEPADVFIPADDSYVRRGAKADSSRNRFRSRGCAECCSPRRATPRTSPSGTIC